MKPIPALSALGVLIVAHPVFTDPAHDDRWEVVSFDVSGRWRCGSVHPDQASAVKERAFLFRLHRKLAKKRQAKRNRDGRTS